ncbi:MAG: aromatic amino acid transport family protein [Rhabdochlamydiaceae bacterium]|jgi:tyrosine-specific transport protein
MHIFHSLGHVLGGSLLIAGTMVGVGMLALPVATGDGGFIPAAVIYILCWLFMLCTGLLLLEVCSWMPKDSNLITMAHRLLGPVGKDICWVVYLFLFVTVMIAHVVGGGSVVSEITGGSAPSWLSMLIYVVIFSPVVYLGTKWVDRLNITLMLGVAATYFLFIAVSYKHVDIHLLSRSDWSKAWIALPVLFTAFTFQVIIPTLMTYMDRNVKKVRLSIILGTSIPLLVYLIWEFLILGIVPADGPNGLTEAARKGWNAVMPLKELVRSPILFATGKAFAFFTMTTSYIALSLAYLDFLADGLKVQKKGLKKVLLCLAVFIPPTLVAITYPHIFIIALSYAGGFSCAILFGLFPPVMVWVGRYIKKYDRNPLIPGGKPFLAILILFVLVELGIEVTQEILKR